jgi:hypothetical protein
MFTLPFRDLATSFAPALHPHTSRLWTATSIEVGLAKARQTALRNAIASKRREMTSQKLLVPIGVTINLGLCLCLVVVAITLRSVAAHTPRTIFISNTTVVSLSSPARLSELLATGPLGITSSGSGVETVADRDPKASFSV